MGMNQHSVGGKRIINLFPPFHNRLKNNPNQQHFKLGIGFLFSCVKEKEKTRFDFPDISACYIILNI
jgi:hypothetical protein